MGIMESESLINSMSKINVETVVNLFGELISFSPIWFDSNCAIVSVNTQARRLGCIIYILGEISRGRKIESLLLSHQPQEITSLKDNIQANGFSSGYITGKISSVKHYINAAIGFHLLVKQGALFNLTSNGKFLIDAICPDSISPYPLATQTKIFFLYTLLSSDFFGVLAIVRSILKGISRVSEVQREHQMELLNLLQVVLRASTNSRMLRLIQDRMISLRNWKKPVSYSEHLVSAKLNWLIDLGILEMNIFSKSEITIISKHRGWLNSFNKILEPTEPHLLSLILNYAGNIIPTNRLLDEYNLCLALKSVFHLMSRHGNLMKIRSSELVLSLLCFHAPMLIRFMIEGKSLLMNSKIECDEMTYRVHKASRSTQSYIIGERKGES